MLELKLFFPNYTSQRFYVAIEPMKCTINAYNRQFKDADRVIVTILTDTLQAVLSDAEAKIWHAHPVWFIKDNPIVGYSVRKEGVRLLFWSGESFEEEKLTSEGKFKAAGIRYMKAAQINLTDLKRWLKKSAEIQWDYKNIIKRKGRLSRVK